MKRYFIPLLFILAAVSISLKTLAQSGQYGNEWIDYSKTYYKFKVGKNGVCRIYKTALNAAGIPASITGSNFSLFRDGKEVPIWVSADNMGSGDYIEFYGRKADGILDKELYAGVGNQSDDRISLFTDTACYYLTYDAATTHLRFQQSSNSIPGGSLTPEPYLLNTVGTYPKTTYVQGPSLSYSPSDELTSSQFESGEGFTESLQDISVPVATSLLCPNLVPGIPGIVHAAIITRSYYFTHQVKMLVNNTQLADSAFGVVESKHYDVAVPAAQLSGNTEVRFSATPLSGGNYDNYGISFAELEYPRNFDMSGVPEAMFKLPATGNSQYLEFTNLGAARLYDVTNARYYDGNVAVAGKTRFYLDPSLTARQIVVLSNNATTMQSLASVKTIQFVNYGAAANQGNFVIVSHTQFMQLVGGRNYVKEYADYRSSSAGGSHSVISADINDLYDEFAYGYDYHPLSIKHFLKYAYDNWVVKPADVLIIGRGLFYNDYPKYQAAAGTGLYPYPVVPTYGNPGSDVDLIMFGDQVQRMRLGRLPAWTASEVGSYLDKVKGYEAALLYPAVPTVATEIWKKRAMHVLGAKDADLQTQILAPTLLACENIIKDTMTGIHTTTIAKSDNQAIVTVTSALVDSLLRSGTSMITFYGHASPYSFDYNLPGPATYTCAPHFPFFTAMGCDVMQMFTLSIQKTLGEQYLLTPNSGSIGFISSDNVSYTGFDDDYLRYYYQSIASKNYGAPIGTHFVTCHSTMSIPNDKIPSFNSGQLESLIFGGDPSIKLPAPLKPDYHVSADGISSIPSNVSTTQDSFKLKINSYNLGKAVNDSVTVKVEHINPKNVITTVGSYVVHNLTYSDTSTITVGIDKVEDLGLNKYRVTIDPDNKYDEISELNNSAEFDLFIYSDNLIPVYPKEFSIVNKQDLTLKASTLNPFRAVGRYRLEMDTTTLFNSPLKQQTLVTSPGGVVKWKPNVTLRDSVVYYWRTAYDSLANGTYLWTTSSFIYLEHSTSPGWNQSHFQQFGRDNSTTMTLFPDRLFGFSPINHKLEVINTVLGASGDYNADGVYVRTYWDDQRIEQSSYAGVYHALIVMVVDSASGRIWLNDNKTPGAANVGGIRNGYYSRQFDFDDQYGRNMAARFIDSVPNGSYLMIKSVWWHNFGLPSFVDVWKADSTSAGGLDKTLYGVFKKNGFGIIDSFNRERVFVLMRRKGDPSYPVYQAMTDSLMDHIGTTWVIQGRDIQGTWSSTTIGPAKQWQSLQWKTGPSDTLGRNDTTSLKVVGVSSTGIETVLFPNVVGDTSLASISAVQYPSIKLVWYSKDSVNTTSTQLKYWRVLYTPVPEAALNPAIHYVFSDSLAQGQMQTFSAAIENLTELPMDSLLVRYKIIGADGVTRQLADKRYRPLPGLDTLNATITFDPAAYPGKNLLYVEANPANDQPEEYHPNNLGYLPFKILVDNSNPMLDVTFDGNHILNGDIVSAKPFIKISLKDENKYLKLDDTSLLNVTLRYPNQSTPIPVPFDGNTCRFIPASGNGNEAVVEFRPVLLTDGIYQLNVTGADKSGNGAGASGGTGSTSTYHIEFEVDNTPSITNVLNYPNPFSTATAFVFTLTGSQIPSQLKIQILSVTGKVVREITRAELGPLHIGRNITQYQWDGKDQFGQLLGNGVYLYRVVTSLNGADLELRADARRSTDAGNGIDKYFKNGYGKMYIMR